MHKRMKLYKDICQFNEKETLYNNIISLQEYIVLVEDWIKFYNTTKK